MNILIFNWRDIKHSWAGGSEVYIFEIAKRWVGEGHRVTLFCGQDKSRKLPENELVDGINIFRRGGRFSLFLWAPIYYFLKLRKDTDVIIDIENGIPFFTPLFSLKPKICVVHHVHNKQFFYEMRWPVNIAGYLLEKYLFPLIYHWTKVVVVSSTTQKELVKLGFSLSNISIVYNGTNSLMNIPIEKIVKYSRPTIIYLGRIKRYKRIDLLIKLFPEILKRIPSARMIIAGWGTEAPFITDMIMKKNLHSCLRNFEFFDLT